MELSDHQPETPLPLRSLETPERVTSLFEDWCEAKGIHPDAYGAWAFYEVSVVSAPASAAADEFGPGSSVA